MILPGVGGAAETPSRGLDEEKERSEGTWAEWACRALDHHMAEAATTMLEALAVADAGS